MKKPNNSISPAAAQSSSSSSSAVPSHHCSSPPGLSFHRDSRPITKPPPPSSNATVSNNNKNKPPKIRIIHIFAPEIIKTDVANFRELVQRLTGKPTPDHHHFSDKKQFPPSNVTEPSYGGRISDETYGRYQQRWATDAVTKAISNDFSSYSDEMNSNYGGSGLVGGSTSRFEFVGRMVKEEDENQVAWVDNDGRNSDSVFGINDRRSTAEYFEEIDGFIQELGGDHQFPLMEPSFHYQQRNNINTYGSHHQLHLLHGFGEATHQFA